MKIAVQPGSHVIYSNKFTYYQFPICKSITSRLSNRTWAIYCLWRSCPIWKSTSDRLSNRKGAVYASWCSFFSVKSTNDRFKAEVGGTKIMWLSQSGSQSGILASRPAGPYTVCSCPIWKSLNGRFSNGTWAVFCSWRLFPIWKSTNDRFAK